MNYYIKLQDTNRQSFTIEQVKLNEGVWRGSEQFKKYGKLMKIVDYKPLDFKEVKWEPVDGISTQKARSSGANEKKEELEESIRDKWDLECEPLHIIYHNGHLLHGTGKTRKEILQDSYNYTNAPSAIWEPLGKDDDEKIDNIEAFQILLNGKSKQDVRGFNTAEDFRNLLLNKASRYKQKCKEQNKEIDDIELQDVLKTQLAKARGDDPRWQGKKLDHIISDVMDSEGNKAQYIHNYDSETKTKIALKKLKIYDETKEYFIVSMATASKSIDKAALRAKKLKKQVNIIAYLKTLPVSKPDKYEGKFNTKWKAFCKTSYAKIGAMEYLTNGKHDENKVKILGAFAMIVNKHKDDVLVKPLANKNVKKNQKTS